MPDHIFISYRRDDAAYVTGHINDLLRKEFGDESVFTDVDNIALGVDFRAVLDESVSQCEVLLAVIGTGWLTATDRDGQPRLQDPADFVRIEIESALKRNIPVIPLLVSGAKMPTVEELPESLAGLAFRNGTPIRPAPDFSVDMARLIKNLRRHFDASRPEDELEPAPVDPEEIAKATERSKAAAETGASSKSETSAFRMEIEEEDRARHRVDVRTARGHRGALAWLAAIVVLAGASWFYLDQNPEALQRILTSVQGTGSGTGQPVEIEAEADPGRPVIVDDAAESNAVVTTATPAPAIEETDATGDDATDTAIEAEPQQAAATAGNAAGEAPAESVDNPDAVEELPVEAAGEVAGQAEATPPVDAEPAQELAADAAASPDEEAAADTSAPVEDDEITLTPGSQRLSDSSEYISEGVRLAAIGDHEAAIELFDQAIEVAVEPAFAYKQRAASWRALGDFEAAILDYDEAIKLNSEDVNAFYNRGTAHIALQNYPAAIADFDAVIQLEPEYVDAYSRRADAHEAGGNPEAAMRDRATVNVFRSNQEDPR